MLRQEYVAETVTGTIFRTTRLAGFAATLWLLTPWWGRRDLLLVRYHLTAMALILGSVVLGLLVAPGHALEAGRLAGVLWPIPPTQVAHYAAVTLGLVALLWLSGRVSGRVALAVVAPTLAMLLLTHTRTALFAMVIGLVVGGLSLFAARSRVRKAFLTLALVVTVGGLTLAGVVTHWLARGETGQELTALTGRTTVWQLVLTYPRNWFEVLFGFGLSNNSFHGLPIDSNWLATYHDQGLVGLALCAAMVLFLLVTAYFQPRGAPRALALFLVTYCLIASFTETGLSQPSDYLLELTLAASLLAAPRVGRRRRTLARPQRGQPVRPTTLLARAGLRWRKGSPDEDPAGPQPVPLGRAQRREPGRGHRSRGAGRTRARSDPVRAAQRRHRRLVPGPAGVAARPGRVESRNPPRPAVGAARDPARRGPPA